MDTDPASNSQPNPNLPPLRQAAPSPQFYSIPFEFKGETGEYFKIWIVNLFLSVITLGIYIPWAKVRTRRYFHANTFLDGHSFDYLAKPLNLLIGYLVLLVFVGLYNVGVLFNPLILIPTILLYLGLMPWLIYKAFRFKARNTAYRNLRFKYFGQLGESYLIFLAWPMLIPFTLGLIIPYWAMKKKEYFLGNLSFGKSKFQFSPTAGEYYKWYIIFWAIGMAAFMAIYFIIVLFAVFGVMGAAAMSGEFSEGGQSLASSEDPFENPVMAAIIIAVIVLVYLLMIAGSIVLQLGLWLIIFNYNMSVFKNGDLKFKSAMQFWPFCWIAISNTFLSIVSLGFLMPWAKIRITRYMMENLSVISPTTTLGEFASDATDEESAIGDAAVDYFDFEVGW